MNDDSFGTDFLASPARRDFMRLGLRGSAAAALWLTLGREAFATADTSGYKALVCLYLVGGNNGFNMVVPTTTAGYNVYAASRSNLAIPQASLLPLNGTASDGYAYGLHPSMAATQALFNAGHVAILGNVGTLVQPTTLAQAKAESVTLPRQLFSHLDQTTEWMTSLPDQATRTGWAGRMADALVQQGFAPRLAINLTTDGTNYWQEGNLTQPYPVSAGGAPVIGVTEDIYYRNGTRRQAALDLIAQARADSNLMTAEFANLLVSSGDKVTIVNNALAGAGTLATTFPTFPDDWDLGTQLQQVALTIKAHAALDARQIFFVQVGGFDTHQDELATQASLLNVVSSNINAFSNAMNEIGMQNNVTLFTMSEFGRSLGSNGS
ncbi:MAG TPA: DUF1501 domain-containing protein, partial [Rhodocyclaceae bacterium]|nr:DUF1501 domain-containing protein [Rhodocyclaceae bacterium]